MDAKMTPGELQHLATLVETLVRANLRRTVYKMVGWLSATLIGVGVPIYIQYMQVDETLNLVSTESAESGRLVEQVADRPYIDGLATEFGEVDRLVINGTAFGENAGSVELFYKRSVFGEDVQGAAGDSRSITITLVQERIESWREDQIIVTTTPAQQRALLASMELNTFDDLVPYIRIITAERRRSPLW